MSRWSEFSVLAGKTIKSIVGAEVESDHITITTDDDMVMQLYHEQDCCEHVCVEEVHGDPSDLIGALVGSAEEESTEIPPGDDNEWYESSTWTFYRIHTNKGPLVIRWLGTSNGYHSERVTVTLKEKRA